MADIQSAMAEFRRGKRKKKKPQGKNTVSTSAMQGGHKECIKSKLMQVSNW